MQDGQDASGRSYRRNRYYDPSTGRFTQEDPIGIASGLNVYGFAGGDPVNYSDPYGLCPPTAEDPTPCTPEELSQAIGRHVASAEGPLEALWFVNSALLPMSEGASAVSYLGKAAEITGDVAEGAASASRFMGNVRAAGEAGETAAGITKNTERIVSASGRAAYRVPDQLDHTARTIGEVKNVARQGLTSQIRDYVSNAADRGYRFTLYVSKATTLTPRMQVLIDAATVTLKTF